MPFLTDLEDKQGKAVDEATLKGKIVVLFFSSNWCPACVTFIPYLSTLWETVQEEQGEDSNTPWQVVYVSSDNSAADCAAYMNQKHADWLRIPYDSPLRQALKQKYGVFAGREQGDFVGTTRKSGIPTLVVVGPEGQEKAMLDCDSPAVLRDIQSKGVAFLDAWKAHAW